ncbi:hypothetical protein [Aureibacter tunicatorum]|uniref:Uncharacterized protein n=1 Tax=Aureibacter tunicatorum TaxID=866807 RepID=A0AAE3XS25_9BACT|nr:hypothetical protein [Aureibacter tunicatorum]MDR6240424.1 hypothetical protein [Aureibacter tunicatorum]BDD05697.1 hypothetical protein AUTU_31800 [Aureibacter tunicatorum]
MDETIDWLYWYLTDFCLNAANLLGLTYVEFNMLLFLLVIPGAIFILLIMNAWKFFKRMN